MGRMNIFAMEYWLGHLSGAEKIVAGRTETKLIHMIMSIKNVDVLRNV